MSYSLQNLPLELQQTLNSRGFCFYSWISYKEFWLSIQRFFLSKMKTIVRIHLLVGVILLFGFFILPFLSLQTNDEKYWFFVSQIFPMAVMSIYILFIVYIALLHTRKYLESAYIVFTKEYIIGFGWTTSYADSSLIYWKIRELWKFFEEPLFGESRLHIDKKELKSLLYDDLRRYFFFRSWHNVDMNWERIFSYFVIWATVFGVFIPFNSPFKAFIWSIFGLIMIGIFAHSQKERREYQKNMDKDYLLLMNIIGIFAMVFSIIVYMIGSIIVFAISGFFLLFAQIILRITKAREMYIHQAFRSIEDASWRLRNLQDEACEYLFQVSKSHFSDRALSKIEKTLKSISREADICVCKSTQLRKYFHSQGYDNIFDFHTYDRWLRTEMLPPIQDICLILQKQYNLLETSILSISGQITESLDTFRPALQLQEQRLMKQKTLLWENIVILEGYMRELEG